MSSRFLIFLSLIMTVGAVYLYKHRDKVEQPKAEFDARFDYYAEGIESVQTDENGQVALAITAKKLAHDLQHDTLKLADVQVTQNLHQKNDNKSVSMNFVAKEALWNRPKSTITLKDEVKAKRLLPDAGQVQTVTAKNIIYHTQTKMLESAYPVTFSTGNSYINAQALQANLATGVYNFTGLQAQYMKEASQ